MMNDCFLPYSFLGLDLGLGLGLNNKFWTKIRIETKTKKKNEIGTKKRTRIDGARGFTLIELVMVILVISALTALVAIRTGTFTYWKQEAFIRRLSQTIEFLHHQAVTDQAFYRMEFDFASNSFSVGILRAEEEDAALADIAAQAGSLTLELAAFLNPSIGETQTVIPPPSFPSLALPVQFPEKTFLEDIRTMRGISTRDEGGKAYILFSPRGFSEFAVLHMRLSTGAPITILVNPFTGETELFREYREFEWTYGRRKSEET